MIYKHHDPDEEWQLLMKEINREILRLVDLGYTLNIDLKDGTVEIVGGCND